MSENLWNEIYGIRGGSFVAGAEDKARARRMVARVIELRLKSDKSKALLIEVEALVSILRFEGVTWAVIGEALGITKQAAQQRFGGAK